MLLPTYDSDFKITDLYFCSEVIKLLCSFKLIFETFIAYFMLPLWIRKLVDPIYGIFKHKCANTHLDIVTLYFTYNKFQSNDLVVGLCLDYKFFDGRTCVIYLMIKYN